MKPRHALWISATFLMCLGLPALAQSPAPPTDKDEGLFYIRSSGLIADSTFIAASLNGGGSATSEQLALLLLQARDRPTQVTVAGGNEAKTLRVIKDAFDSAGQVDLSLLNFTFVGSAKAAARVEKWVAAVHGVFHTRLKIDP